MTEVYQATESSLQFIIYSQSWKVEEEHGNRIHNSHMAHTAIPNDTTEYQVINISKWTWLKCLSSLILEYL